MGNAWAQMTGGEDAPTKEELNRAAAMAVGGTWRSDGIDPTWAPWELLPSTELGGMIRSGAGAAESAVARGATSIAEAIPKNMEGAVVSNVARNPWASPKELAWGRDITQMAPRDYGILLNQMSAGQPKEAGSMMMGSYLRGKLRTDDPGKIIEALSQSYRIPKPNLGPSELADSFGTFNPNTNTIGVMGPDAYKVLPDAGARRVGVLRHEFEHAADQALHPEFQSLPEFLGRGSGQIKAEQGEQWMESLMGKGPSNNWRSVERWSKTADKAANDIGMENVWDRLNPSARDGVYTPMARMQDSLFNQSRLGDPMHYLEMQSMGHLKNWNSLEGEYAQKMMAQDALNKGLEVHPDIIKKWNLVPQRVLKIER